MSLDKIPLRMGATKVKKFSFLEYEKNRQNDDGSIYKVAMIAGLVSYFIASINNESGFLVIPSLPSNSNDDHLSA